VACVPGDAFAAPGLDCSAGYGVPSRDPVGASPGTGPGAGPTDGRPGKVAGAGTRGGR
jgi:hypothetical protein